MANTNHDSTNLPGGKTYEKNLIGLRGIVFFGIGLFILIVVSFALMWAFLIVLEEDKVATDQMQAEPLGLVGEERLPPEPRLQGAPGFGVDGPEGRINLELTIPQAEYRELERIWDGWLRDGKKDQSDPNLVISMPIEDAKAALLKQNEQKALSREGALTEAAAADAGGFYSYASSGRVRSSIRK
jgi:hypothetical protein